MFNNRRNAAVALSIVVIFAFLFCSLISLGVALLAKDNPAQDLSTSMGMQNQQLIINDMPTPAINGADIGGVVIITQTQATLAGGIILSSYIIFFMIATNVQNFNLFPSQVKLNQSTRQQIYDVILQNEGIHLREICRTLDRRMGVIQYHIYVLESANLISSMKDGRYKRFFVNHQDSLEERVVIALLHRETTAKVLNIIHEMNGKGVSHSAIAKELNSSSQALTWHIQKLAEANVILTTKKGCQKYYQINPPFLPILESLL